MAAKSTKKPALLCVTPHFGNSLPPAGAAALLSFMHANGCEDFAFTDFRTWLLYRCRRLTRWGVFGKTFVLNVPELPIVLKIAQSLWGRQKVYRARTRPDV